MTIEVDYQAWEKWRAPKEILGSFVHTNAEKYGFESYIQNAVVVASIDYMRYFFFPACYVFLAESNSKPISKLLRVAWFNHENNVIFRYLDEIDIDEKTGEEFHHDFSKLPTPRPAMIEYFSTIRDSHSFQINLGQNYGGKIFVGGDSFTHFIFDDIETYQAFEARLDRIIARCKALMPYRNPDNRLIRQAIYAYKGNSHLSPKSTDTQTQKLKRKVLANDQKLLESFRSSKMNQEENLLAFKKYLPRFLEFMAFDWLGKFESKHEMILFGKLKEANFLTWDETEQQAILDYFLALFKYSLSHYPSVTVSISTILRGLIKLETDLAPFLTYWESALTHPDSLRHLGVFLEKLIEENLTDSLPETLLQWFAQASLEKTLEDAIAAYEGKRPYAHEFVEALENLRLIRT